MSNIEGFLQDFKKFGNNGLFSKKALLNKILCGFEAVKTDTETANIRLDGCEKRLDNLEIMVDGISRKLDATIENSENLAENVRNLNPIADSFINMNHNFEQLSINVRNNNAAIEKLQSENELLKIRLIEIKREMATISSSGEVVTDSTNSARISSTENKATIKTVNTTENKFEYDEIDYFDFENNFRGSIERIKKSQSIYLKYFMDKKHVLDIGCGRGEFLLLLKENNVNADGIDVYQPYVDYCNMNELSAVCGDGIEYLTKQSDIDGIFVGQVVEHLKTNQIIKLCSAAYEKLPVDGCIVIETPNPTSLAIYTNAFYIDPSHFKPVHPLTMRYLLEKAGFKNISIIYTENSKPPYSIPKLDCTTSGNISEFNDSMQTVSDIMFGSQDYAVVAIK